MADQAHLINDCFLHDKDRMRHDEVIDLLCSRLSAVAPEETIPLDQAFGRHLATSVAAPRHVPLHDNSAVDGYAFAHGDYAVSTQMRLGPRIAAGDLGQVTLKPGHAARIFTGAVMPVNADSVAMQEDCQLSDDGRAVDLPAGLKPGANRRRAGEDVQAGDTVVEARRMLRPQDIAALASLGLAEVSVYRQLRVGLVSSGNELLRPGSSSTIDVGQVFDSNHHMLDALCRLQPVTVSDLGVLKDERAGVENLLAEASVDCDVILTTGGASRGDEDHMVSALDKLGQRHLWQIAIKPGRPMTFGQIGNCVYLGLPGNPVAAFVCFLLYAIPVLRILGGGRYRPPLRIPVSAGFEIARKKTDRREFLRGWLEQTEAGPLACKFPHDGSGLISGLRRADGLIELPEDVSVVTRGDRVSYIPFSEFGIPAG